MSEATGVGEKTSLEGGRSVSGRVAARSDKKKKKEKKKEERKFKKKEKERSKAAIRTRQAEHKMRHDLEAIITLLCEDKTRFFSLHLASSK